MNFILLRLSDDPNFRDEDDPVADAVVNVNADLDADLEVDTDAEVDLDADLDADPVPCFELSVQNIGEGHFVQQKQSVQLGALCPVEPRTALFIPIQWFSLR